MKQTNHYAAASMLIRKPVSEVFEAFVDPEITRKFWFTDGSARLVQGQSLTWSWSMYGVSVPVRVITLVKDETIEISWGEGIQKSTVVWTFESIQNQYCYVTIQNSDLQQVGDDLIATIRDSTGGFTMVLAGLKAYLEHDIQLRLVRDKWPKEMQDKLA